MLFKQIIPSFSNFCQIITLMLKRPLLQMKLLSSLLTFVLVIALILILVNGENGTFTLEIVYDSLEPSSIRFLIEQYLPAFPYLKDYVYVNACPFGQAKLIENQKIDYCLRGPTECFINFIHICLRTMKLSPEDKIHFVFCTIVHPNPMRSLKPCAKKFNIDWEQLFACLPTVHDIVRKRLFKLLKLTGQHRKFLPIIYFNEQFINELQYPATTRYMETVCDVLSDYNKPKECYGLESERFDFNIYYFALMTLIAASFITFGLYLGINCIKK